MVPLTLRVGPYAETQLLFGLSGQCDARTFESHKIEMPLGTISRELDRIEQILWYLLLVTYRSC